MALLTVDHRGMVDLLNRETALLAEVDRLRAMVRLLRLEVQYYKERALGPGPPTTWPCGIRRLEREPAGTMLLTAMDDRRWRSPDDGETWELVP